MSLAYVKKTYEKFGREDPLYAVLSRKSAATTAGTRTNSSRPAGPRSATSCDYTRGLGLRVDFSRALDFGCGVGRLSQALAEHFEEVVGVDIAESMVAKAREFNRHGDRVRYVVNATDDLVVLRRRHVQLRLQRDHPAAHPARSGGPLRRRVLPRACGPAGWPCSRFPAAGAYRPGSLSALAYRVQRQYLRRLWKIVRGRPPVEIHYVAREDVERIIDSHGAQLVDVTCWPDPAKFKPNFRYCAVKRM